jgi:predicted DNA-binding protein (MmcQ/YjbR family)
VSFAALRRHALGLPGAQAGITPAPYLARAHWVQVGHPKALPLATLKSLVARSHALVAAKLPRKVRQHLGVSP